jgi:GNAT superfamily N-acetyltransferase
MTILIRRLERADMDAAAIVHRTSFDDRLPWLAGLHTPEQDRAFFHNALFHEFVMWGAFDGSDLIGFIAFREGSVDQLYVLPRAQGRGVGGRLLAVAQQRCSDLSLWTFQRNQGARRFYESRGFVAVARSDGSRNAEGEPDIRYLWRAAAPPRSG